MLLPQNARCSRRMLNAEISSFRPRSTLTPPHGGELREESGGACDQSTHLTLTPTSLFRGWLTLHCPERQLS